MDLEDLRQKIDDIDQRLVTILNERANVVKEVGRRKADADAKPFAPDRERAVYQKVTGQNDGPIPDTFLTNIYREIMSASIAMEKKVQVAYLGPEASFTHMAAISKFGTSIDHVPRSDIRDVFRAVATGQADYGIVPAENSIEGSVNTTLDMFMESSLNICADIYLTIHQNLGANCSMKEIKRIYSHPQGFAQCRKWIATNIPSAELIETASTTRAAQIAFDEPNAAAICSLEGCRRYNLDVLARSIEDIDHNTTRFFVINDSYAKATGNDCTSIMVQPDRDRAGALYQLLTPFNDCGINLTKIESRPAKSQAWEYTFFIDFLGHASDEHVAKALNALQSKCKHLQVLGSFPVTLSTGAKS